MGSKKSKKSNEASLSQQQQPPDDGIDYELLGKDRSKCTPEELDQIRRERNRMHAKRTRDRKRLFMEEMAEMCKVLEDENHLLQQHLNELNRGFPAATTQIQNLTTNQPSESSAVVALVSPSLSPATAPTESPRGNTQESKTSRQSTLRLT